MTTLQKTIILTSPVLWAQHWFSINSDPNFNKYLLDYDALLQEVNTIMYDSKNRPIRLIQTQLLKCAFEEEAAKLPMKIRAALKGTMVCVAENLTPLRDWVRAVTGQANEDDVHVMAHWIWLIKRRLLEKSVVHHIMPIIISPKQGGGKSTAVRMLYSPLLQLAVELKIKQAVDERAYTLFADFLIGFFDEMAGAEKIDVNDLKSTLTSEMLSYRKLYTNTQVKIPNLCSFIGTSNNRLDEIIRDITGIRRFFPLYSLPLLDHKTINAIDYVQLWTGVDENKPRGYLEAVKLSVESKQESIQAKDEIVVFIEDRDLRPGSVDTVEVSGKTLYQEYQKHMADAGMKHPLARSTFYRRFRDLGFQAEYKRDKNRAYTWFFKLNKESVLEYN